MRCAVAMNAHVSVSFLEFGGGGPFFVVHVRTELV